MLNWIIVLIVLEVVIDDVLVHLRMKENVQGILIILIFIVENVIHSILSLIEIKKDIQLLSYHSYYAYYDLNLYCFHIY